MKKVFLVLGLAVLFPTLALAGIGGSKHDLRGNASFGNPQEICKTCHIPHKSTTASYLGVRTYSGGAVTFYSGSVGQPTNSSAICLSCHDGTLAPSVGTSSTDYRNSHPYSITYPIKSTFTTPVGGQIQASYGTLVLEGAARDRVECGTCHTPHEPGAGGHFLAIENTNSNLCLTCHKK